MRHGSDQRLPVRLFGMFELLMGTVLPRRVQFRDGGFTRNLTDYMATWFNLLTYSQVRCRALGNRATFRADIVSECFSLSQPLSNDSKLRSESADTTPSSYSHSPSFSPSLVQLRWPNIYALLLSESR